MKNPFKEIDHPPQEVPEGLKEKVMSDVSAVKFFIDVTSLFTENYIEAAEAFFKNRKK